MLKTFGRVADGLLTRLVPKATAAAGDCSYYSMCDGPFCAGSLVRIKRYIVCCPYADGSRKCETYKRVCTCYVGT